MGAQPQKYLIIGLDIQNHIQVRVYNDERNVVLTQDCIRDKSDLSQHGIHWAWQWQCVHKTNAVYKAV